MTTARDIVTQALREGGILALGETLEAESLAEGLQRLNVLIRGMIGFDLGENLTVLNIGTEGLVTSEAIDEDYDDPLSSSYVPGNVFLHANLTGAKTLYLDPNPEDGARLAVLDLSGNFSTRPLTLDANGKKIETAKTVSLNTDNYSGEWFYRKDLGTWMKVSDLAASDTVPFPMEFDDYLVTSLAMRLSRRYGQEMLPETMSAMQRAGKMFKARYSTTREKSSELALQKIRPDHIWDTSTFDFRRGRPWNF